MTSQPAEFAVELPLYSGPFRVLADLIFEQKMDVCDVPVARVSEEFLRRGLDSIGGWSLEEATWFVAVCAVLLELKVGRLLPRAVVETEEDLLGSASPDLVYARSLELAAFRVLAGVLAERMAEASLSQVRTAGPPVELAHLYPDVLANVTPEQLQRAMASLAKPRPDIDLSHVTPIRVSLTDTLRDMQVRLTERPRLRFRELLEEDADRIHVVVSFLAVLELHRQGKVDLMQAELFGDIDVRWRGGAAAGEGAA